MTLDHCREVFIRFQPLLLQCRAPLVEEASRPALPLIVPPLPEGFLKEIRSVAPLVGGEQQL
jgi:hypothetical protein